MLRTRDGLRQVETRLRDWLTRLRLPARAVVLVGSRARGTHWRGSDIDVVVVAESFEGMPRALRIDSLLEPWFDELALEPMGFTPSETLDADGLYLWDALADGRVLQDDGIWAEARARVEARIRRGELLRTPGGWRAPPRVPDSQKSGKMGP